MQDEKPRIQFIRLLLLGIVMLAMAGAIPVHATEDLGADLALISEIKTDSVPEALSVIFMNRHIFTIRSGLMGYSQAERVMGIQGRIRMTMENCRQGLGTPRNIGSKHWPKPIEAMV